MAFHHGGPDRDCGVGAENVSDRRLEYGFGAKPEVMR